MHRLRVVDSFVLSLDEEFFSACSHLELVVISSTGYDKVDLQAATRHGVKVGNTPNFCTNSVAELNLVLIFALARKLFFARREFQSGTASSRLLSVRCGDVAVFWDGG